MRRSMVMLLVLAGCASSDSDPDARQPADASVGIDSGGSHDASVPDANLADAPDPGDTATLRDVVINEVNWFGNDGDSADEWIELHNTSGSDLNLNGWTIEGAGTSGSPNLTIAPGTVIASGGYLVFANLQGPDTDTNRTSLTGVSGVVIESLSLNNAGEALVLKDVAGTLIDQTPTAPWPAGDETNDLTMERRDGATGGGYTDGSVAGAWYSWSSLDGNDTTNGDSSDKGTPGAANTDPDIFDHVTITVAPDPLRALTDATFTITAYSSTDDSTVITNYNGTVPLTASAGTLTGQTTGAITAGVANLTVQNDTTGTGVVFTVTDSVYPHITGSITRDVDPEGDVAGPRAVVISEINWFGNDGNTNDEWIEIRNVSGGAINLAGWTIDNAGSAANAITIDSGTVLAEGDYLVIGDMQGPDTDGNRTSLTGVAGVQIQALGLGNGGEQLVLRDVAGTEVDSTPSGAWPAGDNGTDLSMERRDDITGGGYTDGTVAGAWYTWNSNDGTDTTNADSTDSGTPGAANTDPDAIPPPVNLPYATGFEAADLAFENLATGGYSTTPPSGTAARNGTGAASTTSVTTSYTARSVQSADCIVLNNDTDDVNVSGYGVASTDNGNNEIRARWRVRWYDDAGCATPNATTADSGPTTGTVLTEGAYVEVTATITPPTGATHAKIWFQVKDDNGGTNTDDLWALDDVTATQPAP